MKSIVGFAGASCLALVMVVVSAGADDWPGFRGPLGDGIAAGTGYPVGWGSGDGGGDGKVVWRIDLASPGNGSPIVSNGRVFLTCATEKGRKRSLYCFDAPSGKQLWVRTVEFGEVMPTHKTNPYGGSTPAADGERVVVWHGSAGLHCYDFEGRELWKRDLGEFRHMWGYGTSPVLLDGKVILNTGPGKRVFLTAIDLQSGRTLWETDEPQEGDGERNEKNQYMGSWSTPVVVREGGDGKAMIVCSLPTRVNAYRPETGEIIRTWGGLRGRKGDLAYASPVIAGDICVAMGGYNGPAIGFKLAGGGTGAVTESARLWRVEPNPQRIGTGVFVGGYVYMANAGRNVFQCIEPKTGEIVWEERLKGGAHWGSIVYADGHLYSTNQAATTFVLKPNPKKLEIVSVNELDGEHSNSTPAFADGRVFLRTFEHLFCIDR